MHHVLLPFDGSEHACRAVDYVIAMCGRCGPLKVTLLNVQELPYTRGDAVSVAMTDSIGLNLVESGKRLLNEPAESLKAAGADVATVVRADDPGTAIARQVRDSSCDAIVMGTRGQGRLGGLVLGSVAYKVVHLVQVPVTLVK